MEATILVNASKDTPMKSTWIVASDPVLRSLDSQLLQTQLVERYRLLNTVHERVPLEAVKRTSPRSLGQSNKPLTSLHRDRETRSAWARLRRSGWRLISDSTAPTRVVKQLYSSQGPSCLVNLDWILYSALMWSIWYDDQMTDPYLRISRTRVLYSTTSVRLSKVFC